MENKKESLAFRFILLVEKVGNKLPTPFWLFVLLTAIVIVISFIASKLGLSVTYMAAKAGGGELAETTVSVVNLIDSKQLQNFLVNMVKIYVNFAPLALVIVMTLGISLVEQTGMIAAVMRKTLLKSPPFLVALILSLIGVNAGIASNAGVIFTATIGGAIYYSIGRNPWVGIITGYSAANAGFTACFLISGTDTLLAGITQSAASGFSVIGPTHPLINWYFMIAAAFILTFATAIVAEKVTSKILGESNQSSASRNELENYALSKDEIKGLRYSVVAIIISFIVILILTVPKNALLRAGDGSLLPSSPLIDGIVAILFFIFFFVGVMYGIGSRSITRFDDIPKIMQKGIASTNSFLVVALPASIFIHLFNQSKLTTILAVNGADFLKSLNFGGLPLIISFIILCTLINLLISSSSAKWLILAPIFVPMLAMMNFPPALTQVAYRIGDSVTNTLSPLSYYIPIILGLMQQYKGNNTKEIGVGTLMSLCLPFSVVYLIVFLIQMVIWYLFKIPLGPGSPIL